MSVHENSSAFENYLVNQGMGAALQRSGLQRKLKHTIVPHVRWNSFSNHRRC